MGHGSKIASVLYSADTFLSKFINVEKLNTYMLCNLLNAWV